jgi:hypothetical protein
MLFEGRIETTDFKFAFNSWFRYGGQTPPTQPACFLLFFFYQKPFLQAQAVILGFRLSKLHAYGASSLVLVFRDNTPQKYGHTLRNKLIELAIFQMYTLNLYHFDAVKSVIQGSLWIQHNMSHHSIQEYTSKPYNITFQTVVE